MNQTQNQIVSSIYVLNYNHVRFDLSKLELKVVHTIKKPPNISSNISLVTYSNVRFHDLFYFAFVFIHNLRHGQH